MLSDQICENTNNIMILKIPILSDHIFQNTNLVRSNSSGTLRRESPPPPPQGTVRPLKDIYDDFIDDDGDDQYNAEDRTNLGFVSEDENHGLAEAMAHRVRTRNMQGLDILWRIFWGKLLF